MKALSSIFFPAAVIAATTAMTFPTGRDLPSQESVAVAVADTVIYPADAYKLHRTGNLPDAKLPDSVLRKAGITVLFGNDTTATDSIPPTPEELEKRRLDSIARADKAYRDSVQQAKEDRKAYRDSVREATPRVLETFALPDTMQFKRIIHWTADRDFHDLSISEPDTSFNYSFNDYPFLRRDVNATWLGVAGSPVQTYDFVKRDYGDEGVEFYRGLESWGWNPNTVKQYNSKTPHTELGYFGTLFAGSQKESDNLHFLTTQNIFPEFNFTVNFNRYGGEGILVNEKTVNKDLAVTLNYLGKNYMANAGYIYTMATRGENGGIMDISQIRDTTMEKREILVFSETDNSVTKKHTAFIDQQFRIPFNFIHNLRHKRDSTYVIPDFDKDITSAFVGHSSEFSSYTRTFVSSQTDSMRVSRLDNRVFIRLQPWSSEGVLSKLDVGLGHRLMNYGYGIVGDTTLTATENTAFLYAGARGQFKKYISWNAKAHYNIIGARIGDFDLEGNVNFSVYPFRKARTSPLTISAGLKTSLRQPTFYQEHFHSVSYKLDTSFNKTSDTRFYGGLDIPHWKLNARVNYVLLSGSVYYDADRIARQSTKPVSILSASLNKEFVLGPLHLDNRVLFQMSSDQEVIPLPLVALNLKYFAEFVIQRDANRVKPILTMQVGVNAFYNTPWNTPGYNPTTGTFYNQNTNSYTNGPYFDIFINAQWKRCCIFLKIENIGEGWPMKSRDYFSADGYIRTGRAFKIGIFWPFYTQPFQNRQVNAQNRK